MKASHQPALTPRFGIVSVLILDLLPALVIFLCLNFPWCEAELLDNHGAYDRCDTKVIRWDESRQQLKILPIRYFWCLSVANSSSQVQNFHAHLRKSWDSNYDLEKISRILQSRGIRPTSSTNGRSLLNMNRDIFDTANNSWKYRYSPEQTRLSYMTITGNKDIVSLGYFAAASLVPTAEIATTVEANVSLKPSYHIRGKVFSSVCSPHRSILATDQSLFLTYDGFRSYHKMSLNTALEGLNATEHVVTDVVVTTREIYLLIAGLLYVWISEDTSTVFINIPLDEKNKLFGVSSAPICYRGLYPSYENSQIYVWNNETLYRMYKFGTGDVAREKINISNIIDDELRLLSVRQTVNPDVILVTTISGDHDRKLFQCQVYRKHISYCIRISIQESFDKQEEIQVETTSSAQLSLLIYGNNTLIQVTDSQQFLKNFSSSIETVYINLEKNAWLVRTEQRIVYYGQLHSPIVSKVILPNSDKQFAFLFLGGDDLRYIEWSTNSGDSLIEIDDFRLADFLENLSADGDRQIMFLRSPSNRNVLHVESLRDSFLVHFGILTSVVSDCEFKVHHRFQNLSLKYEAKEDMLTSRISRNIVVRFQSFDLRVLVNCSTNPQECATGYGLLEVCCQPRTSASSATLYGSSQILLINMTCPEGLHLRLGNERIQEGCWDGDGICNLQVREGHLVYLKFEIFRHDEYISDVTDDILLTELNNRTGFTLHNFNLLKKACYHCSQLREAESSSQLLLQTMRSACLCLATADIENKWIANISFENTYATAEQNRFQFSARALSKSLCNLRIEFTIDVVADPSLNFLMWEYIFLLVCVLLTVISLCVSYHKYIRYMKIQRKRKKSLVIT